MTTPPAPAAPLGPQPDDVENLFSYHPPRPDQIPRYEHLRDLGKDFAQAIFDLVPPGPERSTAIAKLREAGMWANAGIACRESDHYDGSPSAVPPAPGHEIQADQSPEVAPGVGATDPETVTGGTAPVNEGPHSRACGVHPHQHGTACHPNCPTCGGQG